MRRILVAVDETEASERVADFVNGFFGGLDVSITAVNVGTAVVGWGPYAAAPGLIYAWPYIGPVPTARPRMGEGHDSLRHAGEEAVETSGVQFDDHVVEFGSNVAATLRRVAAEREVDILVVGSSHKSLLDRLFSPSVSADLAKSAPTPVLVVH